VVTFAGVLKEKKKKKQQVSAVKSPATSRADFSQFPFIPSGR
jgi:hypothetical protein